jgi:hypothetical protein
VEAGMKIVVKLCSGGVIVVIYMISFSGDFASAKDNFLG